MKLIDGKKVADHITKQVKAEADRIRRDGGRAPKLVIFRVGKEGDDLAYERGATKRMALVGFDCEVVSFDEDVEKETFHREFRKVNKDEGVDGILLLRPLPERLDEEKILHLISPEKDIDCIGPMSLGRLMNGEKEAFAPCTAAAVIEMLKYEKIGIEGKRVTIIGRSNVVGRPLALLFIGEDATVTICHTVTEDLESASRNAEILVAACGQPKLIKREHIAKDAIIIDVGINADEDGKLCGDVDLSDIEGRAAICTPVPGGVGAVTTSVLAKQVLTAYKIKCDPFGV